MFIALDILKSSDDNAYEFLPDHTSPCGTQYAPASLIKVVDESLRDANLSPTKIAKKLGMSRASLYRATAPFGGVQRFITDRRLALAHAILTSGDHKNYSITDLAYDLGFNAESTFRRVYKQQYGMSPRATKQASLAR
ncbi:helix-turn-helix domain-containing protein [Kordiimonas pumila]|uniref:Helix-turn-helix domain-containing protein n=1 Tax=Kordiimonas pumila TaxID=2161677 RepID=A0ABV7CZW7_9PROT|nr:helix-turn-helix domain-containing protein [Kordiimonas pumila]